MRTSGALRSMAFARPSGLVASAIDEFDKIEGVISTTVGYTGGNESDPDYQDVASGITGHAEAVDVLYA